MNGRVVPRDRDRHLAPGEPERAVPQQRARHEAGLGEDLEAVADAQDEAALRGERRDAAHHRAEPGDDAGADVVAVGEAAGQDHGGDALERRLLVPQDDGFGAGHLERVDRVAVAVAPREDDDADADRHVSRPRRWRRTRRRPAARPHTPR